LVEGFLSGVDGRIVPGATSVLVAIGVNWAGNRSIYTDVSNLVCPASLPITIRDSLMNRKVFVKKS